MTVRYVVSVAVFKEMLSTSNRRKADRVARQYAVFTQVQYLRVDDKKKMVTRVQVPDPKARR